MLILIVGFFLMGSVVVVFGMIGFVGFVILYIIRFLWGIDYWYLLLLFVLFGVGFFVLVDLFFRMIIELIELLIGIIMLLVGVFVFVFILIW